MQYVKSKITIAATAALLVSLPIDEGRIQVPYKDIAGIWTVCYGHTGKDVIPGRKYTTEECQSFLKQDIERHMKVVTACSKRELPTNKLTAFTSFDFNTGAWCQSRSNKLWNSGFDEEACEALAHAPSGKPVWSYINGTTYVDGLYKRRLRERNKCNEPEQDSIVISMYMRYGVPGMAFIQQPYTGSGSTSQG